MKFSQNVAIRGERSQTYLLSITLRVFVHALSLCGNYANLMHIHTYLYIHIYICINNAGAMVNTNKALEAT